MELIFLQGVVMAKAYYNAIDTNYSVKQKKIITGFLKFSKKEVIVKDLIFSELEINPNEFCENNRFYDAKHKIVMYNPHCDLFLSNESRQTKYFDTKEELTDFMNWLILNNVTVSVK